VRLLDHLYHIRNSLTNFSSVSDGQTGLSFNRTFQQIQHNQIEPSFHSSTPRSFFPQATPMMQSMGQNMEVSYFPQHAELMAAFSAFPQSNIVNPPQTTPEIDMSVYNDLNSLSAEEIEQFTSDTSEIKCVPIHAPARELCFLSSLQPLLSNEIHTTSNDPTVTRRVSPPLSLS